MLTGPFHSKDSSQQLRPHFNRRQALINQAMEDHSSSVPCAGARGYDSPLPLSPRSDFGSLYAGQKGLLNLGASCYLSVVLQTLVHNPLVKNWFMSDKHPHQLCTRAICLCCEMDKLFSEVGTSSLVLSFASVPMHCLNSGQSSGRLPRYTPLTQPRSPQHPSFVPSGEPLTK